MVERKDELLLAEDTALPEESPTGKGHALPQEVKNKALKLYLEGVSLTNIHQNLLNEGVEVSLEAIRKWPALYDWETLKARSILKAQDKVVKAISTRKSVDAEEHLDEYRKIRSKASKQLEDLNFRNAEGATDAIDKAIQGERSIATGVVSMYLVNEIIKIIMDEIDDEEARNRIGLRFRDLIIAMDEGKTLNAEDS